jgi:hypothetical protein
MYNQNKTIHRFKATHFHSINGKDGKMWATDMCDCGCQNWRYEVNEGDVLISRIRVFLSGELKNIKIIASSVFTSPRNSTILTNVNWIPYKKDYVSPYITIMKILNFNFYLDGGTTALSTNKGTFCIDNRLGTKTPGKIFDEYPNSKSTPIPHELRWEVLEGLKQYDENLMYKSETIKLINKDVDYE